MSLKTLARAVLQGNPQGNFQETCNYPEGNLKETLKETYQKVSRENGIGGNQGNQETFSGKPVDLQRVVGEALAEVDRLGRPWPTRFLIDMPEDDRQQLRALEKAIDTAVIANDAEALPDLLTRWRKMLLSKLN